MGEGPFEWLLDTTLGGREGGRSRKKKRTRTKRRGEGRKKI